MSMHEIDKPYPFLVPSNLWSLIDGRLSVEEVIEEAAKDGYRRISKRSSGELQDHDLYLPMTAPREFMRAVELMGYNYNTWKRPGRDGWTLVVHMKSVTSPVPIEDWEAQFGDDFDPESQAGAIAAAKVLASLQESQR